MNNYNDLALIWAEAVIHFFGWFFLTFAQVATYLWEIHWILGFPIILLLGVVAVILLKVGILLMIKILLVGLFFSLVLAVGQAKNMESALLEEYPEGTPATEMRRFERLPSLQSFPDVQRAFVKFHRENRKEESYRLAELVIKNYERVCSFPQTRLDSSCHVMMAMSAVLEKSMEKGDFHVSFNRENVNQELKKPYRQP